MTITQFNQSRIGEKHPSAKLRDDDIRKIRRLNNTGHWSYKRIADAFGVSNAHVSDIINGKYWTHVK